MDIAQARKDAEEMRVLVRKVSRATTRIQELLWQQEACLRAVEAWLFGGGGEVEVIDVDEDDEDDVGDAMAAGLWNCVEEGRVIETLTEEAAKEKGHLTAKTFAQEALWNWRRGGGRKRHAV